MVYQSTITQPPKMMVLDRYVIIFCTPLHCLPFSRLPYKYPPFFVKNKRVFGRKIEKYQKNLEKSQKILKNSKKNSLSSLQETHHKNLASLIFIVISVGKVQGWDSFLITIPILFLSFSSYVNIIHLIYTNSIYLLVVSFLYCFKFLAFCCCDCVYLSLFFFMLILFVVDCDIVVIFLDRY